MEKDKLYDRIDKDESLSDAEKRETYFSEIENDRMEQECEDDESRW